MGLLIGVGASGGLGFGRWLLHFPGYPIFPGHPIALPVSASYLVAVPSVVWRRR